MHKVSMFPSLSTMENKVGNLLNRCSENRKRHKFPPFHQNREIRARERSVLLRARILFLLESGKKREKGAMIQQLKIFHPSLSPWKHGWKVETFAI